MTIYTNPNAPATSPRTASAIWASLTKAQQTALTTALQGLIATWPASAALTTHALVDALLAAWPSTLPAFAQVQPTGGLGHLVDHVIEAAGLAQTAAV